MKKTLLTSITMLFLATGMAHAAPFGCYASSWQICAYKLRHPELYSKWGIRRYRALSREEQLLTIQNNRLDRSNPERWRR
jgi:hypothetical protein